MLYIFDSPHPGRILTNINGRTVRPGDVVELREPPHPSLVRYGLRPVEDEHQSAEAVGPPAEQGPPSPDEAVGDGVAPSLSLDGLTSHELRNLARSLGWEGATGRGARAKARAFLDAVDPDVITEALA